jgi:hypothetical protein
MKFYKYPTSIQLEDYTKNLEGQFVVVEEKLDGSEIGVSFDVDKTPIYQAKTEILNGKFNDFIGYIEFDLFKQWVNVHKNKLFDLLGTRYVMFGEWLLIKHSIYYDMLPHYFIEFDVLDTEKNIFLSTLERNQMFTDSPVVSAPVLWKGVVDDSEEIKVLIGNSLFQSKHWTSSLIENAKSMGVDPDVAILNSDASNSMEGLYIKIEQDHHVVERLQVTRPNFSNSNYTPNVLNQLRDNINLWR